jgi:hypothetical protein
MGFLAGAALDDRLENDMIRVIHNEPSIVSSKIDEVIVLGPDDVDISLTPAAAVQTAGELLEKAAEAIGKKAFYDENFKRLALRNANRWTLLPRPFLPAKI